MLMSSTCSHNPQSLIEIPKTVSHSFTVYLLSFAVLCKCNGSFILLPVLLQYCQWPGKPGILESLINTMFPLQATLWLQAAPWITSLILVTVKFLLDLVLSAIPLLTLCQSPCMMRGDRGILSALWRQILVWEELIEES